MSNFSAPPRKAVRPSLSFWIALGAIALLAIPFALAGGFGGILVLISLFVLSAALYSLVSGRRSWIGLPNRKSATVALGTSFALLIGGGMALPSPPETPNAQPAAVRSVSATTAPATASPTPSPIVKEADPRLTPCTTELSTQMYKAEALTCLKAANGKLVWLDDSAANKIADDRAAAEAALRTVESEAAAKKAAEDAIAIQLAAEKLAAEQVAQQQAIQPLVPQPAPAPVQQPIVPPAPAPAPEPAPAPGAGTVHPGSFCSGHGSTGVTVTGKPMVCAPAKGGRLRWVGA